MSFMYGRPRSSTWTQIMSYITFKDKSFLVRPNDAPDFYGERELMDKWWNIKNGDIIFDIGAGTGLWTLPALACGAWVFAFDSYRIACHGLRVNVQLNKWEDRITISEHGVGNEDKEMSLIDALVAHGAERGFCTQVLGHQKGKPTTYIRLDSIAAAFELSHISYIKIDVESYELDVLLGGRKLLEKYHPKLIIENHSNVDHIKEYMQANSIWQKIKNLLSELKYSMEEVDYYQGRGFLYAE